MTPAAKSLFRPIWADILHLNWKLGLFLILLVCIPRFILVLEANMSGNYGTIGAIMLVSALIPFILLTKAGRAKIGIVKSNSLQWQMMALASGIIASVFLCFTGMLLFGQSYQNWYVYIAKSYNIPAGIAGNDRLVMFVIMAIMGMTFSPIGEELFFRGIVQSSFAESTGEKRALIVDGLAFSLTHIAHFGLVFVDGSFKFYTLPAFLWTSAMFLVSLLFYYFKRKSGSLLGAIVCHAGFNLGMIYSIFYIL